MLYEIFVLFQLWSHMMDDSRIIEQNLFEIIPTKVCCKHQMAKLGEKKKKNPWRGGKGSGKYWGLQFVHSFSSTQALSQALNTEEFQQQSYPKP